MNVAQTIYQHTLNLPESAAREVLDFVEFLEQRYASASLIAKEKNDTETFLAALSGNLSEDFPDDIGEEDLASDTRREELDL